MWCAGAQPGRYALKMLMEHAGVHRLGIQHVVECPALASKLEKWRRANGDEKGREGKRISDLFVDTVKVIFIPVFGMEEEKKKELRRNVKEWNRGDSRPKCEWIDFKAWCLGFYINDDGVHMV